MAKLIELPTGEIAEFPDEMGDDEISSVLRKQFPPTGQLDTAQVPEEGLDSAWDFSGERTLGGRVKESGKAFGRDFLNLFLKGAQGSEALTEYLPGAKVGQFLGDMALDLTGKKDDYLKAKEEQKTYIPSAMDYLNQESILAGDEKYQDLFTTQLGGGVGSIAGFALTSLVSPAAGITLAGTAGVGTQEQKLQQAAESGEDISGFEELYGRTLGGAIGLLDTIPLTRILRFLPKNIPVPDKDRIFTMVKDAIFTGAEEGAQEVASSVLQNIVEMGYNPNAELPSGESLFNDFAIGFVAGGGMQVASDVIRNNRMNAVSQIEYDREREVRMREDANNLQLKERLIKDAQAREAVASDPDAFLRESQAKHLSIWLRNITFLPKRLNSSMLRPARVRWSLRPALPSCTPIELSALWANTSRPTLVLPSIKKVVTRPSLCLWCVMPLVPNMDSHCRTSVLPPTWQATSTKRFKTMAFVPRFWTP